MTNTPIDNDMRTYLLRLAEEGFSFSEVQAWILLETRDTARTINELAEKRDVSYQAIHNQVRPLKQMGLITSFTVGREHYWKCNFDITKTSDPTVRVLIRGKRINIEQVLGYLRAGAPASYNRVALYALSHQIKRLKQLSEGQKPGEPSSAQMQKLLTSMADEFQAYSQFIRQLAELPIFEDSSRTYEVLTRDFEHENTETLIEYSNTMLRHGFENKTINANGFIDHPKPKDYAEYGLEQNPEQPA